MLTYKNLEVLEKKEQHFRKSGIELLKIVAVILIIISHVTQTLITKEKFTNLQFEDGYMQLINSTSINEFILMIFMYLGALGNLIFIICSSYFLIDSKRDNNKKTIKLWVNTIIISLIYLIFFVINGIGLSKTEIIKSLFPITFQNNWFITIYLIFYMSTPYLNMIIERLNQKQLFRLSITLFILYYGISFIKKSFDLNNIIIFVTIYFVVAYAKKYMENFWNNRKRCIVLLILGISSLIILQLFTNILCLKFSFMESKQLYWAVNNNPILFLIAITLFYLFSQMKFKSKFINTISSLSLYIYLIHENMLFRNYTRVYIWHYIYEKIGYKYITIKVITYALILFVISAILSYVYKITFEKIVNNIIEKIFNNDKIKNTFNKIENKLLNSKDM